YMKAFGLLILSFLKTFESFRGQTLYVKAWKKKFKPFSWQCFGEDVCKLIIRFHKVEFHHSIFHLLLDEMVPYVNVFRARVLDVVIAKSNSTFVITVQRNFIEKSNL
ncbi:hypothetical protein Tco_0338076, partial [Tanacetum coccineum]